MLGVFLCTSIAAAQPQRNSWKLKPFALEPHLTHSLADVPLSISAREQIYRAVDNKGIHESFTDQQREQERQIVMSSRAGSIVLAWDGSDQVFVEGPPGLCGARTQCIRIFVHQGEQLHLVFDSSATAFHVQTSSHNGFHDIGTATIWSAWETEYRDYRWNGARYRQADCYWTIYPRTGDGGGHGNTADVPAIADCP
jgi:hypothetical protein